MSEITKIDESKYIVYKIKDLNKLPKEMFNKFLEVDNEYRNIRIKQYKSFTKYLVLKMDDEIDINYLMYHIHEKLQKLGRKDFYNVPIKHISVTIVNSILKLKS